MPADRPVWLRGLLKLERAIGQPLEAAIQSDRFLAGITLLTHLRSGTVRSLDAFSSKGLHAMNLPAYSDLRRLRDQLARLDRELRGVAKQLEDRESV